ncbi:hypothetical protein BDQ12DRAFT_698232 [Crucibulum laeve]|uniref:Nephrocystin 3-like N-terminal domain-containing protein n=1 Tax=Crucibulum laeve TaxID=68775 RepID=A0A5C3M1U5_9AGAR|nr:hypothetical protein BDQ12DRAFT_698232 [Crucibulum laeve]
MAFYAVFYHFLSTRIKVLDAIMSWIRNGDRITKILWLNGPAGAGKSAIAQTICEMSAQSGHLAANPMRNSPAHFFSTIAYQLAIRSTEFKIHLEKIVEQDPLISTKAMDIQLQKLLLLPSEHLGNGEPIPPLVVIDGLDECINENKQVRILQLISNAASIQGFPFCFLIASRPERHISTEFQKEYISQLFHQISLANIIDDARRDILLVLECGFLEILENPIHRDSMHHITRPWPSQDIIEDLASRAVGNFLTRLQRAVVATGITIR